MWVKNNRAGKADGRRRLREALKAHKSWKPADSASVLRFTDQLDVSGCTAPQVILSAIMSCHIVYDQPHLKLVHAARVWSMLQEKCMKPA